MGYKREGILSLQSITTTHHRNPPPAPHLGRLPSGGAEPPVPHKGPGTASYHLSVKFPITLLSIATSLDHCLFGVAAASCSFQVASSCQGFIGILLQLIVSASSFFSSTSHSYSLHVLHTLQPDTAHIAIKCISLNATCGHLLSHHPSLSSTVVFVLDQILRLCEVCFRAVDVSRRRMCGLHCI